MKIFMTGASGFVGRAVCQQLVKEGHDLRCLMRPGSEGRLFSSEKISSVQGDLFSEESLLPLLEDCEAVIHLVGIIREIKSHGVTFQRLHQEATRSIVNATLRSDIKRYLHMSANGTRPDAVSSYHKTKWLAEEVVRQSDLDWTIFRPSLIYGPEDQFINMIASLIKKLPIIPVIGDGEYQMQPVPVEQVAESFGKALKSSSSIGKSYHCAGADCLSYKDLLDIVGRALGKSAVSKIHQPLFLMRPVVSVLQHFSFFPMTKDQLQMLLEGNCCDTSLWTADFDIIPDSLAIGLEYLNETKRPEFSSEP